MDNTIDASKVFIPSDEIVAREIEGELIIVPIVAGIGDAMDDLFTLNETGRAIWKLMDGQNSLKQIAAKLAKKYNVPCARTQRDVVGLATELRKRRMIVEKQIAGNGNK